MHVQSPWYGDVVDDGWPRNNSRPCQHAHPEHPVHGTAGYLRMCVTHAYVAHLVVTHSTTAQHTNKRAKAKSGQLFLTVTSSPPMHAMPWQTRRGYITCAKVQLWWRILPLHCYETTHLSSRNADRHKLSSITRANASHQSSNPFNRDCHSTATGSPFDLTLAPNCRPQQFGVP